MIACVDSRLRRSELRSRTGGGSDMGEGPKGELFVNVVTYQTTSNIR
jgi:hypothetical protein